MPFRKITGKQWNCCLCVWSRRSISMGWKKKVPVWKKNRQCEILVKICAMQNFALRIPIGSLPRISSFFCIKYAGVFENYMAKNEMV